ncbi:MAG: hypothetical protein ACOY5B_09605 [Spirochaetota bacterium]
MYLLRSFIHSRPAGHLVSAFRVLLLMVIVTGATTLSALQPDVPSGETLVAGSEFSRADSVGSMQGIPDFETEKPVALDSRKPHSVPQDDPKTTESVPVRKIIDFQKIVLPIDRVNGGSYTNHSPFVTWVKGENSDRVYPVPPGVTYPWTIDGFADPIVRPGQVFKVIDGLHIVYDSPGGAPEVTYAADSAGLSPAYLLAQSLQGGWKDERWHREIRAKTDFGWDNIFEVARPNLATAS